MRRRLAHLLRTVADWLHPDHEITVNVRPVIVGRSDMEHTLRVYTHIERDRLGFPAVHCHQAGRVSQRGRHHY